MSECGANGRFSIVALTRRIVMRSDIELQSVLRYRRINSRCANGEVHIAWLGHNAVGLCAENSMTTLNHRDVTLGKSADRRHKPWQTEKLMTIRTTLNRGGVRITVD